MNDNSKIDIFGNGQLFKITPLSIDLRNLSKILKWINKYLQ